MRGKWRNIVNFSRKLKRTVRNYRLRNIHNPRPLLAILLLVGASVYGMTKYDPAHATQGGASVSISPSSQTVAPGGNISYNVSVSTTDTGSGKPTIDVAQFYITFDKTLFDSGSVSCASGLTTFQPNVDTTNGQVSVVCYSASPPNPVPEGVVATVQLHAKTPSAGGVDNVNFLVDPGTDNQSAVSSGADLLSLSTTGATFTVDGTPPQTTIDSSPSNPSNDQNPSFSFSSSESNSTFQCQIDGGSFSTCTSPKSFTGLSLASHTFNVKATDQYGNTDASPASYAWTISNNVPTVSITAPANNTKYNATSSPVTITADAASAGGVSDVKFQVDGVDLNDDTTAPYASTAWDPTAATDGNHTITAIATDATSSNTATTSVTVSVDNTVPSTTINSGPSGTVQNPNATFTFSSDDNSATFECQLDGGSYTACTSPKNLTNLSLASHTFNVRAKDANGNVDATPATQTWTVADTTAPSDPGTPSTGSANTTDTTPTWNWTASTDTFGINHYEVEWCTVNTFTGCGTGSGNATSNSASFTHSTDLPIGTWYFRVRSVDNNTNPSNWVTGTVDVQLPPLTISSFNVAPSSTAATVTWTTSSAASTQIKYAAGLAGESFDVTGPKTDTGGVTSHTVTISNLISCVTYHVQGLSDDTQSRSAQSTDTQFSTGGCPGGATVTGSQSQDTTHTTGGSVDFNDGDGQTTLAIPANASAGDLTYQVLRLSPEALGIVPAPTGLKAVAGRVYQFKALSDPTTESTQFDQPLNVVMHYTDDQAKAFKASTLQIFSRDTGNWNVLDNCAVDTSAKTVTCTTTHFSSFALFGEETSSVQQAITDVLPKTGASALKLLAFCGLVSGAVALLRRRQHAA
jgi:hypothetical protein